MKTAFSFILALFFSICAIAQTKTPPTGSPKLPPKMYVTMRDSTTSIDIVYLVGKGSSISLDDKNIRSFNSLFENVAAEKPNTQRVGTIMWQINGREYLSGNFFVGDSTGCVVIEKDGKEYINRISTQGNSFLKSQIKN